MAPSRRAAAPRKPWFVYMLECKGNKIYTGIALDVAARFAQHRSGKGAAYTRANPPLRILAAKSCRTRSEALKLEHALKQLERPEKLAWAAKFSRRSGLFRARSGGLSPSS